jgi:hypothetical protein
LALFVKSPFLWLITIQYLGDIEALNSQERPKKCQNREIVKINEYYKEGKEDITLEKIP